MDHDIIFAIEPFSVILLAFVDVAMASFFILEVQEHHVLRLIRSLSRLIFRQSVADDVVVMDRSSSTESVLELRICRI